MASHRSGRGRVRDSVGALLARVREGRESALCDRSVRLEATAVASELGGRDGEGAGRRLLTLLYITIDDSCLRRPAPPDPDAEFVTPEDLAKTEYDDGGEALKAACVSFADDPTHAGFAIASGLFGTWKSRSRAQAGQFVLDSITMARVRGDEPSPSLMHQARQLGVEREAISRWRLQRATAEEASASVHDVVRRAFWDRIRQGVGEHMDYDALWSLAGELRDMALRLLFAAPRWRALIEERWDVELLRQQSRAALSSGAPAAMEDFASTLRNSILYVTGVLVDMVAPADRDETRRWADAVRSQLDANPPMDEYLRGPMIDWLRSAFNVLERIAAQVAGLTATAPQAQSA